MEAPAIDPAKPSEAATDAPGASPAMPWWRRLVVAAIAILLGWGCGWIYLTQTRYQTIGDAYPAELMPISLIFDGDLDLSEYAPNPEQLPYWYKHVKGRTISFYPIIPGLVNWPAFYVAHLQGIDIKKEMRRLCHWTCAIITGCSVSFMFLALVNAGGRLGAAIFFALVYAFATAAFSTTSRTLWQHGPSLFFLTGALALVLSKNRWLIGFAGFMLGMAVWNRPTNVAFAAPLGLYVLIFQRRAIFHFIGFTLIPVIGLAWYSLEYWGTLSSLGQGHFREPRHGSHITALNGPLWDGLLGVLISPARGLFVFSPIFLLAIPALLWSFVPKKTPAFYAFLSLGALIDIYIYARWTVWWGGHSFGYRMLIETVPAMIMLLALAWELWLKRHGVGWTLVTLLVLPSFYFQYLGFKYYPSDFNHRPNVDTKQETLWQIEETELIRLQRKFNKDWFGG